MGMISSLRSFRLAAATVVLVGAAGISSAASAVSFTGDFTVNAHQKGSGLTVDTDKLFDPINFELLTVGESVSHKLFRIWTDEGTVNADDFAPQDITVAFNFNSPVGSGAVDGETSGAQILFGLFQGGGVQWEDPALISFDDGSELRITLSDADFNWGMFGINSGVDHGAIISADFELISDTAAVIPLPAGLPLLLSGIGGLALLRRRRNAAEA